MKRILQIVFALIAFSSAEAQTVSFKTNIVDDAFLSPNLGVEVSLGSKWSVDLSGEVNAWKLTDGDAKKYWKHWLVQPELRYWFCSPMGGHFAGVHLLGGQYNFGGFDFPVKMLGTDFRTLKKSRHQGWYYGVGVAYGYTWLLNRHWNIEGEIGVGYVHTQYDAFRCAGCGKKTATGQHHNYYGPTKVAINLIYVL